MRKIKRNIKHSKKYKTKSKFIHFLRPKGYIADIIIIVLVVVFSLFLVGNLFPKFENSSSLDQYEIAPTPSPDIHDNLQLKTFGFKKCSGTVAIDFLIDMSGSMAYGTKLKNLQDALKVFANSFPATGAIAMQTYNVSNKERVPFSYFQDSKNLFLSSIAGFQPYSGTHSKDAMTFAKSKLDAGRPKFPGYNFALIFISDGIPETLATNINCPGGINGDLCSPSPENPSACRCFATDQDPTEIADQIKTSGVRIFTIRYIDTTDQKFNTRLTTLMQNVASDPNKDAYLAPLNNQIEEILKQITVRICNTK